MSVNMTVVAMKDGSEKIKLETPFHPALPQRLSDLGGKWSDVSNAWYLATDLQAQVRELCLSVFGIDPLAPASTDLVDVEYDVSTLGFRRDTDWQFGRAIIRRFSRDGGVKVGENVSILSGGFAWAGGSRANPIIGAPKAGTVLLVREVPRAMALEFQQDNPELGVKIIERTIVDRAALVAEAKRLGKTFSDAFGILTEEEKIEVWQYLEAIVQV